MLVRIIRKPNLPIFNASEKGGPLLRHLNWKRFIDVIDQVGGRANNKMSLPSTDIMKQLKADIAPVGDIRDPDFQYLSQYLSFRGIGLGAQKLSRYHLKCCSKSYRLLISLYAISTTAAEWPEKPKITGHSKSHLRNICKYWTFLDERHERFGILLNFIEL